MNIRVVLKLLGGLLLLTAATLIAPLAMALAFDDPDCPAEPMEVTGFLVAILAAAAVGLGLRAAGKTDVEMRSREAFAVVPLSWVLLCLFGALPFLISGATDSFTDAYFETMSGFSTTGSTIFTDIEHLPHGILFWRSVTHWLGGMGIVVLFIAILPSLGTGGGVLMRAELPGVSSDKMLPRVSDTAKLLWLIYLTLTVAETLLLLPAMNWFDALCHAFGTLATGGFSTKDASIGYYNSAYVDTVITIFMLLAGTNFLLHYQCVTTRSVRVFWRNPEFRCYLILLFGVALVATVLIHNLEPIEENWDNDYSSLSGCFRYAIFQVAAVATATGYATADFDLWPNFCRLALIILMFVGACSGSTGGGMKNLRIMLLAKFAWAELSKVIRPRAVVTVKYDGKPVEEETLHSVIGFSFLFIGIYVLGTVLMCLVMDSGDTTNDFNVAISSVVACMSNIGPGLGEIGPAGNYSGIPLLGKWILIVAMLVGRLEIFAALVLFSPLTWRR